MSRFIQVLFLAGFALWRSPAQTTAGRFSGTVSDPSGGGIPSVEVSALNSETGQKVTEKTTGEGRFVLYPLPPGLYTITAKKDGFNAFTISDVKVEVADSVVRNITLQVGAISQSVSVTADAAVILTDSPSIEATIVRRQIEELPLNGRDFNQLVLLSAGSVDNQTGGNNDFGSVALNGNRTYGNAYLVDGTPNTNSYQGTSAVPLSIDVIREFKVYSGVAPAEFGQGGSQITVVTQGGTNAFHGNLFEYYRGTQLEASAYGTSAINFRTSNGNSIYNAMNFEVRHRFYRHVIFQGNWTWAKGIDDVGQNVQSALLDVQNLGRDRANSDYVRRHAMNLNGVYDLPIGRGQPFLKNMPRALETALGGWKLGGIWHFATGRYLTPMFTSSGGLSNSRPDVVYGVQANLPRGERTAQQWFNPAAFAIVPATDPVTGMARFGNAGRNIIVGPGTNYMDANLAKVLRLGSERRTLTLRVEAFNLLNHPNYGNPALNISNTTTVASITNVLRPMREVQFAARFAF